MTLNAKASLLLVVDMQARLIPAMHNRESLTRRVVTLQRAARSLSVPQLATEQNPAGIGETLPEVAANLEPDSRLEKMTFDATAAPLLVERLRDRFSDRRQMVVCGAEAHVCVLQTAMGLQREGYQVFVVADAVGTRAPDDLRAALERMQQAGLVMVTTEMVVFEWLARSDRPEFRDVLKLIK